MKEWSVIIPTRNEEHNIALCLDSLHRSGAASDSVEVVVVDNGSTDDTVSIAKSYSTVFDIQVLSAPKARVGAVRNTGARAAKGKFLAFVDADCIIRPFWLDSAARILSESGAAIVGAHYDPPSDASWVARLWHRRFHKDRQGPVSYIPGGNLLMASSTFWAVGGFDPDLGSNEDSQFCSRARAMSIPVLTFPELAVTHLGAEKDLLHFVRRQVWHGGNVINRSGLRGNVKAIGLAAYTLVCLSLLLLSIVLWQPGVLLPVLLSLLLPAAIMALRGGQIKATSRDFPPLFLLLLTYSLVRACVLPMALLRGARHWSNGT